LLEILVQVLYRHGIDFRLMSGQGIAILDASHSLFGFSDPNKDVHSDVNKLVLKPIPQFREIVANAVRDAQASGSLALSKVATIEVGVICDAGGVKALTRVIHSRVLESIKS